MSAKWTPENGQCFFCPNPEEGYARKDASGEFQPCCFECACEPVHKVNKEKPVEKSEFD